MELKLSCHRLYKTVTHVHAVWLVRVDLHLRVKSCQIVLGWVLFFCAFCDICLTAKKCQMIPRSETACYFQVREPQPSQLDAEGATGAG